MKPICARSLEDRDIASYPRGEAYRRLLCGGREILDYAVGREAVRENLAAARRLSPHPVWSGPGPAYATLAGPGPEDFAEQVRAACDCGEVLRRSP